MPSIAGRLKVSLEFDFVVAGDPLRGGADGRQLAALLACTARRGWRTGFLPLAGPTVLPARPIQPHLARLLESREVLLVDPAEPARCRLALAFETLPLVRSARRPPRLISGRALLRLEAPPASWSELVPNPAELLARAGVILGGETSLVPADPLVAAGLASHRSWCHLPRAAEPWPMLVALHHGAVRQRSRVVRIGRHGHGPWPPGEPFGRAGVLARRAVLAEEAAERALLDPDCPQGMELLPGDLADPVAFLDGLDAWVMPADRHWIPILPAALLEALAAGCPTIVPEPLAELLGEAAAAAETEVEVFAALDGPSLARAGEAARAATLRLADPDRLIARLEAEIGQPAPAAPRPWLRRATERPRRLLMIGPNGIGIGHLVRLLAIARRLPGGLEPVILSMSQAVGLARRLGFLAEYLPAQAATRESADRWSAGLRARLDEAIAFYDPACVVFDGNVPYQALVDCRLAHADRPFVWLRRGFWRPEAGRTTIERGRHFDLIIEPGDLAFELDRGITRGRVLERVLVPPVVLLEPEEVLARERARAELGLDPGKTAVLIELGARNNFDYRLVDRVLEEVLSGRPEIEPVLLEWPISDDSVAAPPGLRKIQLFPAARWLAAFDLAIAACGYNSFHELLAAGVPTVFVPNENPTMDEQERRALWAEAAGVGLFVRAHDPYRLRWAIEQLLQPEVRARMRARAAKLPRPDGGKVIAGLVAMLARSWPQERRPDRLPRALSRG